MELPSFPLGDARMFLSHARARLRCPIAFLLGLAVGSGPVFGRCLNAEMCDTRCPAANSCTSTADCPGNRTCVRYGAPGQPCLPGTCTCTNDSWACTDDCAPQCTASAGASGAVPDRGPGPPLRLTRVGPQLLLEWGASCLVSDTDYEVYEGLMGSFSSH